MYTLQKETGWTDEYLLWGTSWLNFRMKLADAPYYKYGRNSAKTIEDEDELVRFLSQNE